jgi:NTE family protein
VAAWSVEEPAALVLGGGGVLGEAWMTGVLAGLEESGRLDARSAGCFVGTSAGSIVAAALAAGVAPGERIAPLPGPATPRRGERDEHDRHRSGPPAPLQGVVGDALAPLAALALRTTAGGGALLRRGILRGVPAGRRSLAELHGHVERSGVVFDGRLLVVAVERRSGRRVVFGSPAAPPASVADAVCASCAIPGVFEPVSIAGREYLDGGVWSPTNLDVAAAGRGEDVVCLNPTGSLRPSRGTPAAAIGPVSRGIAGGEALAIRHRGVRVHTVNPDARSLAAMGANLMDWRRREAVLDAALAQGRALSRSAARAS